MSRLKSPHAGLPHLNGHLVCAVDVETTGFVAGYHELIQLAVLPLNEHFLPSKTAPPFYANFRIERPETIDPEAMRVHGIDLKKLATDSISQIDGVDYFDKWFDRLNLPIGAKDHKKIMPLWSNGSFDKSFIMEWLGYTTYSHYFHFHERDTQSLALEINDRFAYHGEPIPFPRVGLNALASHFNIKNERAHDALSDCYTTCQVYKNLIQMFVPLNPGAFDPRKEIGVCDGEI